MPGFEFCEQLEIAFISLGGAFLLLRNGPFLKRTVSFPRTKESRLGNADSFLFTAALSFFANLS